MVTGYKPPVPLSGHVFNYGKTGSGKTWKNTTIVQYYHSHEYKIWDIYGGLRREGGFWCFPSDEIILWRNFMKKVGLTDINKCIKKYEVDLYYPHFKSKIPNELPQKLPRIKPHIFTINIKDLSVKDVAVVIGGVSGNQERILNRLKNELSNESNGQDILEWFNKTSKRAKMKRFPIYYGFFEPFCREQIFEGSNGKFVLNDARLRTIAKERNRVFVLAEDYIPDEKYRYFFINFMIRKLFDLVNEDRIHKRNIVFLREINLFMKIEDESVQYKEQKQVLRNEFSNLLRYGRSGVFAVCDTQSPKEVRGITPGQEGILCLNRLPGERDREEACERPRKDGRMNSTHIAYLGMMPVEEMAVLEQGKNITKVNHVQPPRTMGWKPETGKFINIWKKKYNQFVNIKEDKEFINKSYVRRKLSEDEAIEEDYEDSNEELDEFEEKKKEEKKETIVKVEPKKVELPSYIPV